MQSWCAASNLDSLQQNFNYEVVLYEISVWDKILKAAVFRNLSAIRL